MEKDVKQGNTEFTEQEMNVGEFGEEAAAKFLKKNGCKILARNFRAGREEIDIIARIGKLIIFVEVKTRTDAAFAQPWEAVGFRKRRNLKIAAKLYLQEAPSHGFEFRFDVISVTLNDGLKPQIEWIPNAF